jgi:predicted ribosomally synthesized peptide with nif11-like leader
MSEQNVLAFVDKTNNDKSLASRVKALPTRNLSDLLALAQSEGFAFTSDEWQAVSATAFGGELDDSALDQVTGGAGGFGTCNGLGKIECNGMLPAVANQSLFKSFGK